MAATKLFYNQLFSQWTFRNFPSTFRMISDYCKEPQRIIKYHRSQPIRSDWNIECLQCLSKHSFNLENGVTISIVNRKTIKLSSTPNWKNNQPLNSKILKSVPQYQECVSIYGIRYYRSINIIARSSKERKYDFRQLERFWKGLVLEFGTMRWGT